MPALRDTVLLIPSLTGVAATGVLTSDTTNVTDGDTVTIGTTVYRFKTIMLAAYDVQRDATSADVSLGNLVAAINGTGAGGNQYYDGTLPHPLVTASAVVSHATTITAIAVSQSGNAIATTETSSHLSFGGSTLANGSGGQMKGLSLTSATTYYSEILDMGQMVEAIAFLNVTAHSGTGTLDVSFQLSPDKVNWIDSGDALAQVIATNSMTIKKFTAIFGRWVRVKIIVTGTPISYTFDLSIVAKS